MKLILFLVLGAGCSLAVGCGRVPTPQGSPNNGSARPGFAARGPEIRTIKDVMSSFQAELAGLSDKYPELAEAKDISVNEREVQYIYNCVYWGKRGYEDKGPNAIAIGLRVMPTPEFCLRGRMTEVSLPSNRWPSLEKVGWVSFHIGKNPSPGLAANLEELVSRHCQMIDELDRLAAPPPKKARSWGPSN